MVVNLERFPQDDTDNRTRILGKEANRFAGLTLRVRELPGSPRQKLYFEDLGKIEPQSSEATPPES